LGDVDVLLGHEIVQKVLNAALESLIPSIRELESLLQHSLEDVERHGRANMPKTAKQHFLPGPRCLELPFFHTRFPCNRWIRRLHLEVLFVVLIFVLIFLVFFFFSFFVAAVRS
jgi:hypothetical protein